MKKEVLNESLPDPADGVMTGNGNFKPSHYNFLFDAEDGTHLIYNTMSGGFATVKDEDFSDLQQILRDPNSFTCNTDRERQLFQSAIRGGYIINEDVNELDVLKTRSLLGRFSTEHFHLTIMPTLACNFKCTYCYEEPKPGIMSRQTQEVLIKWVEEKTEMCKLFTVGWFDGEPLLAFDCMKYLSAHFKAACDKKNVEYRAGLTTNGYLLNEKVIGQLDDLAIRNVQVTVDGPPEVHNQRRRLKNGQGTFHVLLRNLEYLAAACPDVQISIRVNCDASNIHQVHKLFQILPDSLRNNADIYFATVYSCNAFIGYEGDENKRQQQPSTLSDFNELRRKILELRRLRLHLSSRGKSTREPVDRFLMYPRAGYCEADYANRFVVDPEGSLHKCTVSFSPELRVGYLTESGRAVFNLSKLSLWLAKDPFQREKCRSCKLLPSCMGGCYSSYLVNPNALHCATILQPDEIERVMDLHYKGVSQS